MTTRCDPIASCTFGMIFRCVTVEEIGTQELEDIKGIIDCE